MALRDEIKVKQNKLADLQEWVDARPNRDEWLEIILNTEYSMYAVAALLNKHGFRCDHNVVFRFRKKNAR